MPDGAAGGPPASAIAATGNLAVVTGASSGIGAATARALAARGMRVLAGVRRPADGDALATASIVPVLLDITEADAVAALARRVGEEGGQRRLRALVNNAGAQVNAPVETLPLDEWRRLFEVNLFGHVAVTKALLPALIEGRGTVVNISSVGGRLAMAGYGPYAAAKFALEAVSDSLRRETAGLGVRVVVVEPGAVATGMLGRVKDATEAVVAAMTADQRGRYATLMRALVAQAGGATGIPAEAVAQVVADAVFGRRPRTRYTVGRDAAVIARLARYLPDRALDRLLARSLKRHGWTEPTAA